MRPADHSAPSPGAEERPHPRTSYLTTRYSLERPGTHWVHHFMLRAKPWDMTMVSGGSLSHGSRKSSTW